MAHTIAQVERRLRHAIQSCHAFEYLPVGRYHLARPCTSLRSFENFPVPNRAGESVIATAFYYSKATGEVLLERTIDAAMDAAAEVQLVQAERFKLLQSFPVCAHLCIRP
jgi:hypothetical protein